MWNRQVTTVSAYATMMRRNDSMPVVDILQTTPKEDKIVLLGDSNARVAKDLYIHKVVCEEMVLGVKTRRPTLSEAQCSTQLQHKRLQCGCTPNFDNGSFLNVLLRVNDTCKIFPMSVLYELQIAGLIMLLSGPKCEWLLNSLTVHTQNTESQRAWMLQNCICRVKQCSKYH